MRKKYNSLCCKMWGYWFKYFSYEKCEILSRNTVTRNNI
jgi:hypothetical protein